MSRPQDLSKWEHLSDIQSPEIDGEEVTLLLGANVPEAQTHEEVFGRVVLYLGGPLWVHLIATLEDNLTK